VKTATGKVAQVGDLAAEKVTVARNQMKSGFDAATVSVDKALEEARKARERVEAELIKQVDNLISTFAKQASALMDSAQVQLDGMAGRIDTAREQLLAPLATVESSIKDSTLFDQVVAQARTQIISVMDGLSAQVIALGG
jgi:hypothetical protein